MSEIKNIIAEIGDTFLVGGMKVITELPKCEDECTGCIAEHDQVMCLRELPRCVPNKVIFVQRVD